MSANLLATKRIHQQINIRKGFLPKQERLLFPQFWNKSNLLYMSFFFKLWTLIRVIKVFALCLSISVCISFCLCPLSVSFFSLFFNLIQRNYPFLFPCFQVNLCFWKTKSLLSSLIHHSLALHLLNFCLSLAFSFPYNVACNSLQTHDNTNSPIR